MLKKEFAIALAYAGISQAQWAVANGFRRENVHHVLTGKAKSARIQKQIMQFVAEQLPNLRKELLGAA